MAEKAKNQTTIKEAVKEVMRQKGAPMTIAEACGAILSANLYKFNSPDPEGMVRHAIRRHCADLDFASAASTKEFERRENNAYYFLDKPYKVNTAKPMPRKKSGKSPELSLGVDDLKKAQTLHKSAFVSSILGQLKKVDPYSFEKFAKNLLVAYGFEDVQVTQASNDGGIDGFGKLKIGLASLQVAFQCKRFGKSSVSISAIREFRGTIQGQYDMGIFFTTSKFTRECEKSTFQAGAVPIIMIDGEGIVDIMIEKEFGVEKETIPLYRNALDLALEE